MDAKIPGCGHPGCGSDDVERHALSAAAAVLVDDELTRVCQQESSGVKPDFRSRRHALEVKQLTSPALKRFFAAHADHLEDPHRPIEGLSRVWLTRPQCSPVNPDVINVSDKCDQPEDEH